MNQNKEVLDWFRRNSYLSMEGNFYINNTAAFKPVPKSINESLKEQLMSQNKEVREQPQWVVDILDRLDKLEDRFIADDREQMHKDNLRYLRSFDNE